MNPEIKIRDEVEEGTLRDREEFQRAHGIIGRSREIAEIVDVVRQVAPTDITVLITGESGTGKEVIANAIHAASSRVRGKFVAVNCGAIPEGILESELFGHERGSFTGAAETRKGYFEIADGGTIFLDEIGEMPIATQVKLLRVLENGEFMRVGSSESRRVDVRVIAATNKELERAVEARQFRQDLYYRLRSVNVRIPPLRNRRVDIPLLVNSFLAAIREKHGTETIRFTDDAYIELMRYPWPGNVRELKNVIESVAVLEHGTEVDDQTLAKYLQPIHAHVDDRSLPMRLSLTAEEAERERLFQMLLQISRELYQLRQAVEALSKPSAPLSLPQSFRPQPEQAQSEQETETLDIDGISLEEMEKRMIARALDRFEGNRRHAAEALGISERTLYRKIRDYRL